MGIVAGRWLHDTARTWLVERESVNMRVSSLHGQCIQYKKRVGVDMHHDRVSMRASYRRRLTDCARLGAWGVQGGLASIARLSRRIALVTVRAGEAVMMDIQVWIY